MDFRPPHDGYIAMVRIAGIPTYVHWSFPVGGLVTAAILGDLSAITSVSTVAAYVALIMFHELGHALFAFRGGARVHAFVVTAGGGFCAADLPACYRAQLLFLAGGLLAQLCLFMVTVLLISVLGSPSSRPMGAFALVFTLVNAIIFLANVFPYGNNDGARIWSMLRVHRR